MAKNFSHTFSVSDEQLEELKLLQKAMQKHALLTGSSKEDAKTYYTMERVFEFVMKLGQNHLISKQIENAAYFYAEYYDKGSYPYDFGRKNHQEELKSDEEQKLC